VNIHNNSVKIFKAHFPSQKIFFIHEFCFFITIDVIDIHQSKGGGGLLNLLKLICSISCFKNIVSIGVHYASLGY
jgi:hypothetical protein